MRPTDDRGRLAPVDDPEVIARVVAILAAHRPERRKASSPSARTPADGPPDINESESLSNVDITELEQPDINPRADRHVPTDVGDVDVPSASVAGDTEQVAA